MRLLNCIKNIIKEERIGKLFGDIKVKVSIETSSHGNTQRFRHGKDEVITKYLLFLSCYLIIHIIF